DNQVNIKVALKMLSSFGCKHVTIANNGHEAVEEVKRARYDIVFMDCHMPVCDGYDATRAIREWEKQEGVSRVTIVALTANALINERKRCLSAGMDDYLAKPVSVMDLKTMVVNYCLDGEFIG
ncbi:MAG: response regulator, partial [Pseudomonadota bacterium]